MKLTSIYRETEQFKEVEDILSTLGDGLEGEDTQEKKSKPKPVQDSFLFVNDVLYEQIFVENKSEFIKFDVQTEEVSFVDDVMKGDIKVIPQQGEEVAMGAVKLPSGVTEYGDTLALLTEIEGHIDTYLDVTPAFRKFMAYYVLLSWLYDRFNTLPYLRFLGDTGCGKSRALDVCGGLCYKPIFASGCITPAPIYRMIRRWGGTVILDEADLRQSDEYNEVVTILNCGFERNRPVIRATKNNPDKLQFLPTFGPKVFATRRRFNDPALEARCLTEIMQETQRTDIPSVLTSDFYRKQEELRNKLLMFRLRNYTKTNPEQTATLDLKGVEPRLKQISASFAVLFANQPDVLKDYQCFIREHQKELVEQRAATSIGRVVETLFNLIEIENETLETIATIETGKGLLNISSGDIADKVKMTPQAVGQILKTLGIQTKAVKVKGSTKRCILYEKEKFESLRGRYIPHEDEDEVAKVSMVSSPLGLNENETEASKGNVITSHVHEPNKDGHQQSEDSEDKKETFWNETAHGCPDGEVKEKYKIIDLQKDKDEVGNILSEKNIKLSLDYETNGAPIYSDNLKILGAGICSNTEGIP
jgi:hypothetical protein